jgi:hypothetical protein
MRSAARLGSVVQLSVDSLREGRPKKSAVFCTDGPNGPFPGGPRPVAKADGPQARGYKKTARYFRVVRKT